jgi:hypothetical protein
MNRGPVRSVLIHIDFRAGDLTAGVCTALARGRLRTHVDNDDRPRNLLRSRSSPRLPSPRRIFPSLPTFRPFLPSTATSPAILRPTVKRLRLRGAPSSRLVYHRDRPRIPAAFASTPALASPHGGARSSNLEDFLEGGVASARRIRRRGRTRRVTAVCELFAAARTPSLALTRTRKPQPGLERAPIADVRFPLDPPNPPTPTAGPLFSRAVRTTPSSVALRPPTSSFGIHSPRAPGTPNT